MATIVINKITKEVIACISSSNTGIVKDCYEVITTQADKEPIFENDNGVIKLNLTQWESED